MGVNPGRRSASPCGSVTFWITEYHTPSYPFACDYSESLQVLPALSRRICCFMESALGCSLGLFAFPAHRTHTRRDSLLPYRVARCHFWTANRGDFACCNRVVRLLNDSHCVVILLRGAWQPATLSRRYRRLSLHTGFFNYQSTMYRSSMRESNPRLHHGKVS